MSGLRKNVAGQVVKAQLTSKTDGGAVTSGTTTVYVTIDDGTQTAGSGTVAHKGNGEWKYLLTQAETNGTNVSVTWVNSSAVNVTKEYFTVGYDPTAANLPANVAQWDGSNVAAPDTAGCPKVTIKSGTGTGEVSLSAGLVALASAEYTSIADALLKRDWTAVTGEATRSVLNALRLLRNVWTISGGTMTVTKEDDTTTAWTGTAPPDNPAAPLVGQLWPR